MQKNKFIRKIKEKRKNIIWMLISYAAFLLLWYVASNFTAAKIVLPGPQDVLVTFFKSFYIPLGKYTILGHIGISLGRVMVSFVVASSLGIILGVLMARIKLIEAIIKPIFELLRPIPPLAWIPLSILWFGLGEMTKYFLISIAILTPVLLNTYSGAKRTDKTLIGAAKMLGASDAQVFTRIVLPATVPSIFAGLQFALSVGWMAVLAAEMVQSTEGAGWIIIIGMETGNTAQIVVGMLATGLIGLLLILVLRGVEGKLCKWNNKR